MKRFIILYVFEWRDLRYCMCLNKEIYDTVCVWMNALFWIFWKFFPEFQFQWLIIFSVQYSRMDCFCLLFCRQYSLQRILVGLSNFRSIYFKKKSFRQRKSERKWKLSYIFAKTYVKFFSRNSRNSFEIFDLDLYSRFNAKH